MLKLKRKPRKRIRATAAAERVGCSTDTLVRNAREWGLTLTKLNPTKQTSPYMCFVAELEAFEQRIG